MYQIGVTVKGDSCFICEVANYLKAMGCTSNSH